MLDCKSQILSSIPDNNCCSHAFINSVLLSCAIKQENSYLISAKKEIINKIIKIIRNFYPNISMSIVDDFLIVKDENLELEKEYIFDSSFINLFENACDKATIVKTFFVLNGNFYYNPDNNQNSKGYSLEINFKDEKLCDICNNILIESGFELRKKRKSLWISLYSKNSNIISDLLVFLGASYSALDVQNSLAIREIRNTTNRQNNCFESNLDKTLSASKLQLEAINYIIDRFSIDYFDENLREIALVRLANPDVSLGELKTLLNNNLSRAGIKYRLDKIIDMYKELKGEN
ncbi:MAG: DNA-binding protein WhiA [Clostridia bacterium]|nr:DNA-binding protein WhiA [Clostridia bacterium]